MLAITNTGYLKPVELLVKVYPRLNNQVLFLAYVQNALQLTDMKEPK